MLSDGELGRLLPMKSFSLAGEVRVVGRQKFFEVPLHNDAHEHLAHGP